MQYDERFSFGIWEEVIAVWKRATDTLEFDRQSLTESFGVSEGELHHEKTEKEWSVCGLSGS